MTSSQLPADPSLHPHFVCSCDTRRRRPAAVTIAVLAILFCLFNAASGLAQQYGPPFIDWQGTLYSFYWQDYIPSTSAFGDFYSTNSGDGIYVDGSGNVYDQSGGSLGTYNLTTFLFSTAGAAAIGYDDTWNYTFLGLPAGVVVRDPTNVSSGAQLYDGSYHTPNYSCPDPANPFYGVLQKYTALPPGDVFQIGSSPWYVYNGSGDAVVDTAWQSSWPISNIFAAPPQNIVVNGAIYNLTTVNPQGGPQYYEENNVYVNPNTGEQAGINRYLTSNVPSGDIWGYQNGNYFSGSFDPNTWAISGIAAGFTVTFSEPGGYPTYGPPFISWNLTLLPFLFTDSQGVDFYGDSSGTFAVHVFSGYQVSASSPSHSTTGSYDPVTSTFNFNGDASMTNFLALDFNGDVVGVPNGVTLLFGANGSGEALMTADGTVVSGTPYTFRRPDGSWGLKYVGLPDGPFLVQDSAQAFTSPIYSFQSANGDTIVNAISGWPPTNLYPWSVYVNGSVCNLDFSSITDSGGVPPGRSGSAHFADFANQVSLTISWTWNTAFLANEQLTFASGGTASGAWDGLSAFSSLPSSVEVSTSPTVMTAAAEGAGSDSEGISLTQENSLVGQPLGIQVLGSNGQPLPNAPVQFWINAGSGEIATSAQAGASWSTGITVYTDENGRAQIYVRTSLLGGLIQVAAAAGTAPSVFFNLWTGQAAKVACGVDGHTLLVKSDGSVWAFGLNDRGQIGRGLANPAYAPAPVLGLTNVSGVSAGNRFSLALKTDGAVWAWGANDRGQLGNSALVDSQVPVQVLGLNDAVTVAAGEFHALALAGDGTVWAWGRNTRGELGNGNTTDSNTPVQVSGLTNVIAIAAGGGFSVAVKSDGTVWTWGANGSGQLGNNSTADSLVPVQAAGISNASSVSAGHAFVVAVGSDSAVWSWGSNGRGQLGIGTTTDSWIPVQTGFYGAVGVSAGSEFAMAFSGFSGVYSWGANDNGQLGDGMTADSLSPVWISSSWSLGSTVATGENYAMIVDNVGATWAWGNNSVGQFGCRNWLSTVSPELVNIALAGTTAAGAYHTLALNADGSVWAWGDNSYGELGNGSTTQSYSAVQVQGLSNITSLAAGFYHSLALKNDGTVWAWGANWSGQLGNGSTTPNSLPVQVQGLSGIVAISAGDGFSLALDGSGNVWAWGTNADGELGAGSAADSAIPVLVSGLNNVFGIAAGDEFAVALKSDGSVWAWGANWYGQLGNNSTVSSSVPVQVQNLDNVVAVSAGTGFALALDLSGNVWSWGANWYGQLGNNSTINSSVPVQVQNIAGAQEVAAGDGFGVAVTTGGNVYTWGANWYGQLGNGSQIGSAVPVQAIGGYQYYRSPLSGIISVSVGDGHVVASTSTGALIAWGENDHGQLGIGQFGNLATGNSVDQNVAVNVTAFIPAQPAASAAPSLPLRFGISAGFDHTVALKNDGTVWTFGNNGAGQLGVDLTVTQLTYPVQVPGLYGISRVTANGADTFALKNDGTVWFFGGDAPGLNTANNPVPAQMAGLNGVVDIAAGFTHIVAAKGDGSAWSWGWDAAAQFSSGPFGVIPVQVEGLNSVVSVAAGGEQSFVVKSDGTVWAWGANPDGELGNGTTTPTPTPVQVSGLTNVVSVAAGDYHTLALKADGTVWAWGSNSSGPLGDYVAPTLVPVQVAGLSNVVAIAAGDYHSLAIKSDGTVWAWGSNSYGQLGVGANVNGSPTPIQVAGFSDAIAVSASSSDSFVVKADGTVWAFGLNQLGQLGIGTVQTGYVPEEVFGIDLLGYAPASISVRSGVTVSGAAATVTLEAVISDNAGDVTQVDFYNGTTLLGSANPPALIYNWQNVPPGTYSITVRTTTTAGLTSVSSPISVKVMRSGADSISAGGSRGSILRSDGTVWSWGGNEVGELGDGSTLDRFKPVYARAVSQTVAISDGESHSLALTSDGTVWAWGENGNGQLGNNSTVDSHAAVQAAGLTQVIAIAGGGDHSMALTSNGSVWTWGANANGQLGNGSTSESHVPAQVAGISAVSAIAAGGDHSVALKADGTVWTWGLNGDGQLGNGSTVNSSVPVQVSGLTGVVAIAAGQDHCLALKTDGTIWAWGRNESGQLGMGTTADAHAPVQVSGLTGMVAIAGGGDHSLALKGNGTVWAWGLNANGQLGVGSVNDSSAPVQVSGPASVVAIACGSDHSLALDGNGAVWAWGANTYGQIGIGTNVDSLAPAKVNGLTGTIATGEGASHTLALHSDGTVWAWGANDSGQLGNGSTANSLSQLQVQGLTGAVAVAAGASFSVALESDGSVWTWGANTSGQLGDGTMLQRAYPSRISSLSGIVAISAGANYALALCRDGTVWAWGGGASGQLGSGGTANSPTPVQVGSLTGILAISAGGYHGLALKSDGTVWAWGHNNDGQLGNGAAVDSSSPVQVSSLTGVAGIAAGDYHSLALLNAGTVWAWGDGANGQLGNNSTANSSTPVQVANIANIIDVAAGQYHSIAYRNDGAVFIWGDNSTGELGNSSTTNGLVPAQVTGFGGGAVSVSSGSQAGNTMLLKSDGTLWGWGLNTSGQLGNGTTLNQGAPVITLGGAPPGSGTAPTFTLLKPADAVMLQ